MADRFVDLQDDLVGRQQYIHRAARAVRREQQLQRLVGDATPAADEFEAIEHRLAALLRESAIPVEGPGLGVPVGVRRDRHPGHDEAVALDDVAAGARQITMLGASRLDRRLPVDDSRVAPGPPRFVGEQLVPLALRPAGCVGIG